MIGLKVIGLEKIGLEMIRLKIIVIILFFFWIEIYAVIVTSKN